jgi:hypothetical protein
MNNIKIIYVSVIKLRSEPMSKLSGKNLREFTGVKLSFLFARRCLHEQAEQEVSDRKRNLFSPDV